MADFSYSRQARNQVGPNQGVSNNIQADLSVDPGQPIVLFDEVRYCDASAAATANCAGLCVGAGEKPAVPGAPGQVRWQYAGPLTLTTAQWDRVTGGSGGLTPHAIYYLSTTPGELTTTPPTNPNYITPVGFALSATTLMIHIDTTKQAPPS